MIGRMAKSIVTTVSPEDRKKKRLTQSIEKKTMILEEVMAHYEMLKVELELIQHEYNVRVGALLLKDNQLDLEILQLKNLKELMRGGMTYQQAVKYEEDAFYSQLLEMQKEQEKIEEEKKMLDEIADVADEVKEQIKTVWKKLIRQFHPDLVTDPERKKQAEELMKKINKAYTENNLEALLAFEETQRIEDLTELTVLELEDKLAKIEQSILDAKGNITVLQHSVWFEWKKKMEKGRQAGTKRDVFADLEKKFLDDLVKKIEIVQKLRQEVQPHPIES